MSETATIQRARTYELRCVQCNAFLGEAIAGDVSFSLRVVCRRCKSQSLFRFENGGVAVSPVAKPDNL